MIIYEDILLAFQKEKVKYVLVGGIAVNLLGSFRSTSDMDILLDMSVGNWNKAVKILQNNGYRLKQPINPVKLTAKVLDSLIQKKNLKALTFYRDKGVEEVDIIVDSPISFKQALRGVKRLKSGSIVIPVVSIANLITMKKASSRSIDKLDIRELKIINKLRNGR